MERLKTQFIFRVHTHFPIPSSLTSFQQAELETMTRKPPLSARSRKTLKDPPSTPIHTPSQIRAWGNGVAGPSRGFNATPMRSQANLQVNRMAEPRIPMKSPEVKRSAMLPGFQNSFLISTPIRSPHLKGKALTRGAPENPFFSQPPAPIPITASPASSPPRYQPNITDHDFKMENPVGGLLDNSEIIPVDIDVDDEGNIEMEYSEEEVFEEIEPYNWDAEVLLCAFSFSCNMNHISFQLARVLLTHTSSSSENMTFQTLLGVPVSTTLPAESAKTYSTSCAQILEVVASVSKHKRYSDAATQISRSLLSMISTVHAAKLVSQIS